ncbi:hypothetical protein IEO21_08996 [Rhodonia placenta]|uniref:Uncharacterized protein n=1 Tax=Rhodonia placenta TaxID=104341 RepID=A0A8H7NVD4_9APHY|nr:hypothetical protein IEO21_08996 [Postia placenta]
MNALRKPSVSTLADRLRSRSSLSLLVPLRSSKMRTTTWRSGRLQKRHHSPGCGSQCRQEHARSQKGPSSLSGHSTTPSTSFFALWRPQSLPGTLFCLSHQNSVKPLLC